jgi:WD40 repeat protein
MAEDLQNLIARVKAGSHDQTDIRAIAAAIRAGRIVLVDGYNSVDVGGDVSASQVVPGNQSVVGKGNIVIYANQLNPRVIEEIKSFEPAPSKSSPSFEKISAVILNRSGEEVCPYQGLDAFTDKQKEFFFGRKQVIEEIQQKLHTYGFVPVIGTSGIGKSSVIRAGLIPQLKEESKSESQQWHILEIKPGAKPLAQLQIVLEPFLRGRDKKNLERIIEGTNTDQHEFVSICNRLSGSERYLLVVDQFEEIFVICDNAERRNRFIHLITQITVLNSRLAVVVAIRSDFFDSCLEYPSLMQLIKTQPVYMSPLSMQELEEVIAEPAKRQNYSLQPGLLGLIFEDIGQEKNCLPLLQFALTKLWEKRDITQRQLSVSQYINLGRLTGSLDLHADRIYRYCDYQQDCPTEHRSAQEQKWIKTVFLRLVREEAGKYTRQRQNKTDLLDISKDNLDAKELIIELIEELISGRLLVAQQDGQESSCIDLAHEALIDGWKKFVKWRSQERDLQRLRNRIRYAFEAWQEHPMSDHLMMGGLLGLVRENWKALKSALDPVEEKFYQDSLAHEQERIAQLERALEDAYNNRIQVLCQSSQVMLLSNKKLNALLEILKAVKLLRSPEWNIKDDIQDQVYLALQQTVDNIEELNSLEGHRAAVRNVCFSPNADILASGSDDGTVKLWTVEGNIRFDLTEHSNCSVRGMCFSSDGKVLAIGTEDGSINLWSCDGEKIGSFLAHEEQIRSLCFSPNSRILASGGKDATVKLWYFDGKTIQLAETLSGHKGWVNSVSFSPNGEILASGSADETIKLWNLDGSALKTLEGHKSWVNSVSFSPDGQILASGSRDCTVVLWNLEGHDPNPIIIGSSAWITSVAFHPSRPILAFGGDDYTIRLYNRETGKELQVLSGHSAWISSLSFSPDGQMLASGSGDNSVRFWDLRRLTAFKHSGLVNCVSFSRYDKIVASGSSDHTVKLWDLDGQEIKTFKGHTKDVWSVRFSPNDEMLASGSDDCTIILWDRQGSILRTLEGHAQGVKSVRFSPDGKLLASGHDDGKVILWNPETGENLHTFTGHSQGVRSVRFSPDGKLLASGSDDRTVRLWNVDNYTLKHAVLEDKEVTKGIRSVRFPDNQTLASGSDDGIVKLWSIEGDKKSRTLKVQGAYISSLSFNSQKPMLASGSADGIVRLWNLNGQELQALKGHKGWIRSVSFSSDGKILASGSADSTIRLWYIDLDKLSIDRLIERGCDWVQNYLSTNSNVVESDRHLCDEIRKTVVETLVKQ